MFLIFNFWCACFRIPCRHELCMQAVTMSYHYIFHNFPSIYNSIQDARQRSIAVMLAKRLVMHTFLLSLQVWMYALTERERERETKKKCRHIIYNDHMIVWFECIYICVHAYTILYRSYLCLMLGIFSFGRFERSQKTQVKQFHFMSCCLLNLAVLVPENSAARNDPKRVQESIVNLS